MLEEKLREIEGLINQELDEYAVLSDLYDDKKQYLIKTDLQHLSETDNKIKEKVKVLNRIEQKRKAIDEELGLKNANLSKYIELANENALSVEQNLKTKKIELAQMSVIIANKEKRNLELIKHGMGTVNKLISIIIEGATKSNQYNLYGKTTHDEYADISSIVEEV